MQHLKIYVFLLIMLTSCGQAGTKSNNFPTLEIKKISQTIETPYYVILKFDKSESWIFENSKPTNLSLNDIREIEILLSTCIKDYNSIQLKRFNKRNKEHSEYKLTKSQYIIDLKKYNRQFIAVINAKGEKEVWVNCFCAGGSGYWNKEIVSVDDGGNCFFNVKINLTRKTYRDLRVNRTA